MRTKQEKAAQIDYWRDKLEEAALQFARIQAYDRYIETYRDGKRMALICASEKDSYLRLFRGNMEDAATNLLVSITDDALPERKDKA